MPKRTSDCEDQISTARQMPANWQSGTDADRRRGDSQQVKDAEQPCHGYPGAPSKLPGYGGGK
jgi:hypothetical protein